MLFSRRALLSGLVATVFPVWAGARQGLDQFAGSEPPCEPGQKLTPAVTPDGTFRAGSPQRSSLVEPGATGPRITVIGTVAGLKCGRIKGATIDVWQADARGQLDASGFRLRGHLLTDANGRYRLTSIIPGAAAGRAPHLSIRVQIAKKIDFWTEAYFPDNPANARDSRFRPELLMKKTADGYVFDIFLDL